MPRQRFETHEHEFFFVLLWSFSRSTHLTLQSRKDKQDSSLKLIKQGPSSHAECCGLTESKPLKVGQYDHKKDG